jgi:hypothetical protein
MRHLGETLLVFVAAMTIALGAATVGVTMISGSQSAPASWIAELEYSVPGRGPMTPKPAARPISLPGPTPSARPGYP